MRHEDLLTLMAQVVKRLEGSAPATDIFLRNIAECSKIEMIHSLVSHLNMLVKTGVHLKISTQINTEKLSEFERLIKEDFPPAGCFHCGGIPWKAVDRLLLRFNMERWMLESSTARAKFMSNISSLIITSIKEIGLDLGEIQAKKGDYFDWIKEEEHGPRVLLWSEGPRGECYNIHDILVWVQQAVGRRQAIAILQQNSQYPDSL